MAIVKLEMSRLLHIMGGLKSGADRIVEESARAIEGGAKAAAPVDTGALRASITVENMGEAHRKIGPTVDYGIYQELGTRHNRAQPFLKPAFDEEAPRLQANLKGLFDE